MTFHDITQFGAVGDGETINTRGSPRRSTQRSRPAGARFSSRRERSSPG